MSRRVTQIVLYDLRSSDAREGFVQTCNESLAADPEKTYLQRHGPIGSEKWWGQFDAGEIELKTRAGPVTHIGPMDDALSDETEDVVCFEAIGKSHCNDRDGVWADERIQIGDIVSVVRTKATIRSKYGDTTWLIDVRISLEKRC
jgi:hypothetical protein